MRRAHASDMKIHTEKSEDHQTPPFYFFRRSNLLWVSLCGFLIFFGTAPAADWPMWGGKPERNMASETEKELPDSYSIGVETDNDTVNLAATKNIKWVAKVGSKTFGSPVVSQGKVFLGTVGTPSTNATIVCFDEKTGGELGRFICSRPQGRGENWGVCSTPMIEDNRLYFVTPYVEAVCVDLNSWLQSPTATSGAGSDKHVMWRYDMAEKLQSVVDHAASCSVLVHGDFVYVCTGNGRFKNKKQPFTPLAPSYVVFNKRTGQLVARDDEQLGEQTWRGQWSSPSLALVNGKPQILFAGGDSICYAFEPVDPAAQVAPDRWVTTTLRGPIVSFIDVENKDTGGLTPAEYAKKFNPLVEQKPALPLEFRFANRIPQITLVDIVPTAKVPDVPLLKKIWWFDCMPPEYRNAPFYSHQCKGDGKPHPCDIVSTPVFYRNRVYVAIGGDPNHGLQNSRGNLVCIDPTKTGDITQSGKVWSYDKLNATLTTMAITDGLVFVIAENSVVHCLDADTGQNYWTYELKSDRGLLSSALVVADGKVFVGKSILAASRTLKVLGTVESKTTTSSSTPCVANGTLYIVHGKWLWAVSDKGGKKP